MKVKHQAKAMSLPRSLFWVPGSLCLFCLGTTLPTQAQVIQDATLPNPSVVTRNGITDVITGGTQAGNNLFHSFQQFSIPTGNTASFQHTPGIANIISRVTGFSVSNINGLIEVLQTGGNPSSANLFLINPNGIVFGANARLNIGGSFVASTASSLKFADGTEFSATNPKATSPLLTVSVPLGLQFGANPGRIVNRSRFVDANGKTVGLSVKPEKTLALVGGEMELPGGILTTPSGRIELGSVASPGLVSLSPTATGFSLGYEGIQNFQDMTLSQAALVDTSGDAGGNIQLIGKNILLDKANIFSDTKSQNGGSIFIQSQQLDLRGSSFVGTQTYGSGSGSDIAIATKKLFVQNGSRVATYTSAKGRAGAITVNATDSIELIGTSANGNAASTLGTVVIGKSEGAGGNIAIATKQLIIRDGGLLLSNTSGLGPGGNVSVAATDSVELSGINTLKPSNGSGIFSTASGSGIGGNITVTTPRLVLQQGAQVTSITSGFGQGGNLTVNASDSITASGTSNSGKAISTSSNNTLSSGLFAQTFGAGDAGQLTIETGRLRVLDGAQISTITLKDGAAGNLLVRADDVELAGVALAADGEVIPTTITPVIASGLFASTYPNSKGNGATLRVETKRLSLRDGALVQTSTLGSGDAGNLIIKASDSVELAGTVKGELYPSSIQSLSGGLPGTSFVGFANATGKGGNVSITTGNLTVRDGAQVAVSSLNTSDAKGAGNLEVQARNIFLDNGGKLNAETASGNGGNISLKLQNLLLLRRNSQVSATAGVEEKGGDGGNIQIEAPFIVAVPDENSDIRANAYTGNGGKIDITAKGIYGIQRRAFDTQQSDITASSKFGVSGIVNINEFYVDPSQGLVALPTDVVDASQQISQACTPGSRQRGSSFVATGRGGIPPSPTDPVIGDAVLADWITLNTTQAQQGEQLRSRKEPANSSPTEIVEAQGWVVDADGSIVLVAEVPSSQLLKERAAQSLHPWLACLGK